MRWKYLIDHPAIIQCSARKPYLTFLLILLWTNHPNKHCYRSKAPPSSRKMHPGKQQKLLSNSSRNTTKSSGHRPDPPKLPRSQTDGTFVGLNKSDRWRPNPVNHRTQRICHQTRRDSARQSEPWCLSGSELFQRHQEHLHNIMAVQCVYRWLKNWEYLLISSCIFSKHP